tara:strand:- start:11572 stop:12291 length:720 start_codon:yes stop_codon:yes gene_type:complete
MKKSFSIANIAPAIIAAQGELEPVPMDSENTEVSDRRVHKYASFTAMWTACRSVLQKHGLALIQGGGDTSVPGYITLETTVVHTSGEFISKMFTIPLERSCPQAAGSAITYAKRYGLGAFFGLVAEVDDDANSARVPDKKPATATQKPVTKPATATQPEPAAEKKSPEEVQATNFRKATQAIMDCVSRITRSPEDSVEVVEKLKLIVSHADGLNKKNGISDPDMQKIRDMTAEYVNEKP